MPQLILSLLPDIFSVCRLEPQAAFPAWVMDSGFLCITKTRDELSIVCAQALVPQGVTVENGWRGLKVEGPLDFALIGILAGLSGVLAQANISIFAISTYDTDYILVRVHDCPAAVTALRHAGYLVTGE